MKGRWWLNLALLVVVVALALVAVYRPGIHKPPPLQALTTLKQAAISHIRVKKAGEDELKLVRKGITWHMTAPRTARVNKFRVQQLLQLAGAKTKTRFTVKPSELAKYGLNKPAVTVWLNDTAIRFGGAHPMEPLRYVLVGNSVNLLPATYYYSASAQLDTYFNTQLLDPGSHPTAITLPDFSVYRDHGKWRMKPAKKGLSADQFTTFVDHWRMARALEVQPYSGKPVKGHVKIQLESSGSGKAGELELGILARKPALILYRPDEGLEYRFPAQAAKRLVQPPGSNAGTAGG